MVFVDVVVSCYRIIIIVVVVDNNSVEFSDFVVRDYTCAREKNITQKLHFRNCGKLAQNFRRLAANILS